MNDWTRKASEIVADIEAVNPARSLDDPGAKAELVAAIANLCSDAARVAEGHINLLAACRRYIDVDGADRTWEERKSNYNSIYLCVRSIDKEAAAEAGGKA